MMFILVMLLIMPGKAPSFNAHPLVMTAEVCQQAKTAVEADLSTKLKDGVKAELRCIAWGS